jgi:hypothetical protein
MLNTPCLRGEKRDPVQCIFEKVPFAQEVSRSFAGLPHHENGDRTEHVSI